MFTFLCIWIAFTYGYIAAVKHADILDKREQKRFLATTPQEMRFDYADVEPTPVGPNPFVN